MFRDCEASEMIVSEAFFIMNNNSTRCSINAYLSNANWITSAGMNTYFWTSTMNATDDVSNFAARSQDGYLSLEWKNSATINYPSVRP